MPHKLLCKRFWPNFVDLDGVIQGFQTRELGETAQNHALVRYGTTNQAIFLYLNYQLGKLSIS